MCVTCIVALVLFCYSVWDLDDEIEIVAEDKPWGDRSPVVLSSGDTDASGNSRDVRKTVILFGFGF